MTLTPRSIKSRPQHDFGRSSASRKSCFIPDVDLQEVPAARNAPADEENYEEEISPFSATNEDNYIFDLERENVNLSIQEEINCTIEEKYSKQFKDTNEWLREFPSDGEILKRLEPEAINSKGLQSRLEPEEWETSLFLDPSLVTASDDSENEDMIVKSENEDMIVKSENEEVIVKNEDEK